MPPPASAFDLSPDAPTAVHKPRLLDRVRAVARVRHLSIRTEKAYSDWIRRFILFHKKRHPAEMGEEEVRQFLSHLAGERRDALALLDDASANLEKDHGDGFTPDAGQPRHVGGSEIHREVTQKLAELLLRNSETRVVAVTSSHSSSLALP